MKKYPGRRALAMKHLRALRAIAVEPSSSFDIGVVLGATGDDRAVASFGGSVVSTLRRRGFVQRVAGPRETWEISPAGLVLARAASPYFLDPVPHGP